MTAYYNEIEPAAAHVLECLIKDGVIADGVVDTRSITEVEPGDVSGFAQAHFFAGGGLWSVAARLAGWPDDRPMWTGSCPCQPFSVAGKGAGTDDPRHLWPHFFRLIRSCRPAVVMGEQVAGKAGYGWFDGVRADLEGEGYASRAVDIPACAVNAPHIRQRLYWVATNVAHADMRKSQQPAGNGSRPGEEIGGRSYLEPTGRGELVSGDMANASNYGAGRIAGQASDSGRGAVDTGAEGLRCADGARGAGWTDARNTSGDMADAVCPERWPQPEGRHNDDNGADAGRQETASGHPLHSFWHDAEWATGADGKTRRVKPGVRLLVDGLPGRVGLLRIGGNAIVAPLAAEVIKALMDTEQ
jgi:DNA (cytosine-5)-methyltransferase 1